MNAGLTAAGPTDEQAMWRVQMLDDHEAFAWVVGRWQQPILRLCARMTGDLHRAEDLKQEAFARVYAQRHSFKPGGRFSTWLWRIALNLCHDDQRRRNCRLPDAGREPEPGAAAAEPVDAEGTPDLRAAASEERELLRDALLKLDLELRSALALRVCEALSYREVAEVLGVPETTARRRVAEGLAGLSRLLTPTLKPAARPAAF